MEAAFFDLDKTVIAKLGHHGIERELKPKIEVTYGVSKSFDIDAAIVLGGVFDGVEVAFDDGRATIDEAIGPGGECEVRLDVTAPAQPGQYVLEVDALR